MFNEKGTNDKLARRLKSEEREPDLEKTSGFIT